MTKNSSTTCFIIQLSIRIYVDFVQFHAKKVTCQFAIINNRACMYDRPWASSLLMIRSHVKVFPVCGRSNRVLRSAAPLSQNMHRRESSVTTNIKKCNTENLMYPRLNERELCTCFCDHLHLAQEKHKPKTWKRTHSVKSSTI
uniref:Uncharacterized protein n=1 Tax=Opuntia streptacantha TaxID=393608 RepID=A0A7C9AJ84_OPUST